jgi:hypothetical protein
MESADSPICIITSTGLKCLASPLKEHHAGDQACVLARPNPARAAKMTKVRSSLANKGLGLPAAKQEVIARVIELLLAANVGGHTPFTIVSAGRRPRRPRR